MPGTVPRFSSMAVLALALLADSALAQKAEQPDVKVGDQWQFATYYSVPCWWAGQGCAKWAGHLTPAAAHGKNLLR